MKIKDITVTAVIPTSQYANLQPSVTVEVDDDIEAAKALAMSHIVEISQQYAEDGKALQSQSKGVSSKANKIEAFVGGSIFYDPVAHVYTNDKGEVYLSGSQYAKQFEKPFNAEAIAAKMETKSGIPAKTILEIWKLKGNASASFGTAVHEALEMYGKYKEICKILEKEYHQSAIPMVKQIVEDFFRERDGEKALTEVTVVDHAKQRAGRIDRLPMVSDKVVRVQDYKTNGELKPEKLEVYWKQLEFYSQILEAGGYTVQGIDIFHWSGNWKTFSKEKV